MKKGETYDIVLKTGEVLEGHTIYDLQDGQAIVGFDGLNGQPDDRRMIQLKDIHETLPRSNPLDTDATLS